MKKIILVLAFFLISNYLFFVLADADTNIGRYIFKDNGTTDRFGNAISVADLLNTHGWAQFKVGSDSSTDDGDYQTFPDNTRAVRVVGQNAANKVYAGNWTNSSAPYKNATFFARVSKTAGGNSDGGLGLINVTSGKYLYLDWNSVTQANAFVWSPNSPAWSDCNGLSTLNTFDETNGAVWNITIWTNGTYAGCSFNNTPCARNCSFAAGGFTGDNPLVFDAFGAFSSQSMTILFGDIAVFNGTTLPEAPPISTTPPSIEFYNMTSEGGLGCTVWNTDKSNPCNTSDSTPTVFVRTDIFARCAIGLTNSNYSDLGVDRECGSTGNAEHTCTLNSQDELTSEISIFYIGCKSNGGTENLTSTSGALSLNVTGIEANSRRAIELGIRNSLIDNYLLYTNQKVYARNSADNQVVGRFDKVAKKLNKIWAFNRVGYYETLVNMFNITPVLYVLEITNKTNTTITNQVELLINATK